MLTFFLLINYILSGLVVYFSYGMWHSKEREPPKAYDQMISFTGDAEMTSPMPRLEEEIKEQQPRRIPDESHMQESYGSM